MNTFKKITLLSCLALPVHAKAEESNTLEYCNLYCNLISDVAGKIMELRQSDYPMSKILKKLDGSHRSLIIQIYSSPKYNSKEYIDQRINETKTQVMISCIKSIDKE